MRTTFPRQAEIVLVICGKPNPLYGVSSRGDMVEWRLPKEIGLKNVFSIATYKISSRSVSREEQYIL